MEMEEPDVKILVFLTITISLFDGQIFNYKQLALDTKIGDPTKTGRYCEIHQGYLALSNFIWWYVILIVIIEIIKNLKLYMALSESPCFPDVLLLCVLMPEEGTIFMDIS